jgi:hypothetical protein
VGASAADAGAVATVRVVPMADRAQACPRASAAYLPCAYCGSYDVRRLYLASVNLDSCECQACAARWDEDATSGEFRGRAETASFASPPSRGEHASPA